MNSWLRNISGRVAYGLVLWVVAFSTLKQFAGLNTDFFHLSSLTFHSITSATAVAAALFEAIYSERLERPMGQTRSDRRYRE